MAGWWAALPYVCVPLLVYRDEDALAYVTADLAPPGARSERHLLAFEDRRDAGAVQALFAVRSPPDAGVQVCPPCYCCHVLNPRNWLRCALSVCKRCLEPKKKRRQAKGVK